MKKEEDGLMHSVLDNDKKKVDDGKIIADAINQGKSAFTPDMMFEDIVRNYSQAKNIHGEKLIRQLSGYSDAYIDRNVRIPEFRRELKRKLEQGEIGRASCRERV